MARPSRRSPGQVGTPSTSRSSAPRSSRSSPIAGQVEPDPRGLGLLAAEIRHQLALEAPDVNAKGGRRRPGEAREPALEELPRGLGGALDLLDVRRRDLDHALRELAQDRALLDAVPDRLERLVALPEIAEVEE